MRSTTERRQLVLEYLSDHRKATRAQLAKEFSVSSKTIQRDIEVLSGTYPIFTSQGNGGCIKVSSDWHINKRYLLESQEALLRKLLPDLNPEDAETMRGILLSFANPNYQQKG